MRVVTGHVEATIHTKELLKVILCGHVSSLINNL